MRLILGWGNPFRGDDGAGYRAAERAGGVAVRQLTPELAADVAQADAVIFIDADTAVAPGEWTIEQLEGRSAAESVTHSCTPALLLHLAGVLYGHTPPARLIRIGAADLGHGEQLSPAVADAVESAVAYIRENSSVS